MLLFKAVTGPTITKYIKAPVIKIPNRGYSKTGLIPSSDWGNLLNIFFNNTTTYPPRKPAINPPRKPEPLLAAIKPPTIAGANPGLSAILDPMNPARTGIIRKKAFPPPISFNNLAIGLKVGSFISAEWIPNINDIAINIPPPTTNGNIFETPFIKCL